MSITDDSPSGTNDVEMNTAALGYGTKVIAVEPGGNEPIPDDARHGSPVSLFWTWTSPNMEFATIYVGVIAVLFFGQTMWQAIAAVVIGNALGALTHGILTARGPSTGVPQMVISRLSFGYFGNVVPATLMSVMAGVGWFATNSVSGAFAITTLTGLPKVVSLIIVVVVQLAIGFLGHNMIHAFEKYAFPVLTVIFVIAGIVMFTKTEPSAVSGGGGIGGFLITLGAAFGYTAGWNPYATDYSRYLPRSVTGWAAGGYAAAGLFWSTSFGMIVGIASATIADPDDANPTHQFTVHFPGWLSDLLLIAIVLGSISANAVNVYSAGMAFTTIGIRTKKNLERGLAAVLFGVLGFFVALWALKDAAASYEAFLLIIAYWIGPWLGVVFVDQFLRRGTDVTGLLYSRALRNWPGLASFVLGTVASILLFCNQTKFSGYLVREFPDLGDITFFAGFLFSAGLYAALSAGRRRATVSS
ncbi:purine-cytosine permease family protein [Williamsia maris]|uniref:Nucleobase:cation symporter-1, NCS1 family n=1 Tax=Williamsia maris TaxID=72806 RepID=A0ABT1HFV7_9NOCA|nr:nucleobase:cation symporter-1, NCS1 family [Williamsia maris]